jgi:transposase
MRSILDQVQMQAVEEEARKLKAEGRLTDPALAQALGCSVETASKWRRRLQRAGRWPAKPRTAGRPRTRADSKHARRIARLKAGLLTEHERRAVSIAAELALEHDGTVPIPELSARLGIPRRRAGHAYSGLRVAGLCPWPGRGWVSRGEEDPPLHPGQPSSG